jgi:hypothetical protein
VLDHVATRGDRVRFRVRQPDGSWLPVTWATFAQQIRGSPPAADRAAASSRGDRVAVFGPTASRGPPPRSASRPPVRDGADLPGVDRRPGRVHPSPRRDQARAWSDRQRPELTRAGSTRCKSIGLAIEVVDLDDPMFASPRGDSRSPTPPRVVDAAARAIDLDAPGLMLYTSGTSGNPKGVPLTHRNVGVNGADWLRCNAPLLDDEPVDLLWLPMSHIFGWGELCLGNILGWESYLRRRPR